VSNLPHDPDRPLRAARYVRTGSNQAPEDDLVTQLMAIAAQTDRERLRARIARGRAQARQRRQEREAGDAR
jgi:hypothetical protein